MSKVLGAHAVSVDGYVTGRDPGAGRGLGDGSALFDWYGDGDTPSRVFDGFRPSAPSARVFDALAARVGAIVAGRNTYEDSERSGGGSPHRTAAREVAGGRDVGVTGGGAPTAALAAGLVDEIVRHQVPILLGGGRPFFRALPGHVRLRLVEAVPAPGVTHLHDEVVR